MLDKLIEYFLKFPGIGPRQAKRFAYFLAEQDKEFLENLSKEISDIKNKITQCQSCFRFFEKINNNTDICPICLNLNRDNSLLMILEKDVDLENVERSGVYNGKYFLIGSTLPLTGEKTDIERFKKLFEKIKNGVSLDNGIKEVIIALNANVEGENTARYIEKILEPFSSRNKIKISRLGRGLSTGAELEYTDTETIKNALDNRK